MIERTNLDKLEGTRTALECAGFPECFWPFAAPHYCFLDNTSCLGSDGKSLEGGSNYNRAHQKGEPRGESNGCEVVFAPRGLSHGRWEGTGEAGVLAGYGLNSGYRWNGEYLCWSLRELARIDMHEHAPIPFSLRSPHRTRRVLLPRSGELHFPLKEKYDKQTRSMEGLFDAESDKEQKKKAQSMDLVHIFNCPDESDGLGIADEMGEPVLEDKG